MSAGISLKTRLLFVMEPGVTDVNKRWKLREKKQKVRVFCVSAEKDSGYTEGMVL